MTPTNRLFATIVALAALFAFLFNGTGLGLNLLLFEIVAFAALHSLRPVKRTTYVAVTQGGALLTAAAVVLHGSSFAVVMNMLSVLIAVGVMLAPDLSALHQSSVLAAIHLLATPKALLRVTPFRFSRELALGITLRGALTVVLVPLTILLFASMYTAADPHFEALVKRFKAWLATIDPNLAFVFLLGLMICSFLLLTTGHERLLRWARSVAGINCIRPAAPALDFTPGRKRLSCRIRP